LTNKQLNDGWTFRITFLVSLNFAQYGQVLHATMQPNDEAVPA
jgi:hypothetical protein